MPSLSSVIPVQLEMNRQDVRIESVALIKPELLGQSATLGRLTRFG
jgi:hypothetical protein